MKKKRSISGVLIFTALSLLTLSFLYPLFFLFSNALKTKEDYAKNPFSVITTNINMENFDAMISRFHIMRYFANSLYIAVISVFLTLLFSVCASYAFAKVSFKFGNAIYLAIISTMLIPEQVTIIPLYALFASWKLVNNPWSVILTYLARSLPGCILLLTANFKGISNELLDAAEIDGSGFFLKIIILVIPLSSAAIFISIIFNFVLYWNDLFTPMILLTRDSVRTTMVALASIGGRRYGDPPFQMAGLALATLPAILVYVAFSRFIIKGVTMGSIK